MVILRVMGFEQVKGSMRVTVSAQLPDLASPDARLKDIIILDWNIFDLQQCQLFHGQVTYVDFQAEWHDVTWKVVSIRYHEVAATPALILELT